MTQVSRPPNVARSSGVQSGTFSGSLMPPSRKPLETWALSVVLSFSRKLAITRGATPSAVVDPVVVVNGEKKPSNTCVRFSSKS